MWEVLLLRRVPLSVARYNSWWERFGARKSSSEARIESEVGYQHASPTYNADDRIKLSSR